MFESDMTTLIISIKEIDDIVKTVKSLEESGLLIRDVSEKVTNEAKEQKGEFSRMFLVTLSGTFWGSMLTGKGVIRSSDGVIWAGEVVLRAGKEKIEKRNIFNASSYFN